jgi:hypothetical protein
MHNFKAKFGINYVQIQMIMKTNMYIIMHKPDMIYLNLKNCKCIQQ